MLAILSLLPSKPLLLIRKEIVSFFAIINYFNYFTIFFNFKDTQFVGMNTADSSMHFGFTNQNAINTTTIRVPKNQTTLISKFDDFNFVGSVVPYFVGIYCLEHLIRVQKGEKVALLGLPYGMPFFITCTSILF